MVATGTRLSPPSTLPGSEKLEGTTWLRKHAQKVARSMQIVVIGGGAVGVQMATDIKELYPQKSVVLVHSRKNVMNKFPFQIPRHYCRQMQRAGSRYDPGVRE